MNETTRDQLHARVVVASTGAAQGTAQDTTGPSICHWLRERGFLTPDAVVVADGAPVGEALRAAIVDQPAVIITTGGTGVSPSDETPEQTLPLLDFELPGMSEELRRVGAAKLPTAVLSRGVTGFAGKSFIMNLPGSPGGVSDGLSVLDSLLDHLLEQRLGHSASQRTAHTAGEDQQSQGTQNSAGAEADRSLSKLDDSEFQRVLVVVAHPDDVEYGTSAAVSMWTERGIEVGYLLLTAGEAGMQRSPEEAGPLRADEQRAACEAVGVQHLTILDFADGSVEYGLPLRRAIAREIREFQPDVVVSGGGDLRVPWGIDHADHRASGLATLDAVRDAANRWMFPDLVHDHDLAPWNVSTQLITGTPPTHYVEVSEQGVERAIASLAAHEAYLADLPWHPEPKDFVPGLLQAQGTAAGLPHAVTFDVHSLTS